MPMKLDLADKFRKLIHPLLLIGVEGRIDRPIEILNARPEVEGNKIYAINHSSVLDVPISCKTIQEHSYILVGKQSLEIIDRIFFFLNGMVYVDRKDKKSRKKASKKMLKLLQDGKSLAMFPEGTWNLTPSKPMIPLNWGIIDLAKQSGVPIVPLVLEYGTDCFYAKYGEPIYINQEMDKQSGIGLLEESMSTLKWDIWEMFSVQQRTDGMKAEFEDMVHQRLAAYPKFNYKYEMSVVRGKENTPEYVFYSNSY